MHEVRVALLESGFQPTRVIAVNGPLLSFRQPGFTVWKHNDGKSARLSYRSAAAPPNVLEGWAAQQAFGELMMRRLVGHNAALEGAGFVCLEINSRDPTAPYSVWRRANMKKVD